MSRLNRFARTSAVVFAMGLVSAHAATLTVLNTSDAGPGSLRDLVTSATPGDTITFDASVSGTIPLVTTLPLAQNLTIQGPGAGNLTLSGQNTVRVLTVTGGSVTLSGLTVADGKDSSLGGGISVAGTTTLVLDSVVLRNNNAANGGGITVSAGGTLSVTRSSFQNNSTTSVGGGGLINFGSATLTGNTFVGNTAPINGGAINVQPGGVLTAINNTLQGNTSGSLGGAVSSVGTVSAINNTFSGNTGSSGAAIALGNTDITLYNNIFADQTANSSPGALNGTFATSSHNLFYNNTVAGVPDDVTGYGTSNFTATSTHPLGALGNNGGPTPTLLPVAGGAAVCAGSIALLPGGITTDQRGFARTASSPAACIDVGSVQASQNPALLAQPVPTLSGWMLLVLGSLLAVFGVRIQGARRRAGRRH